MGLVPDDFNIRVFEKRVAIKPLIRTCRAFFENVIYVRRALRHKVINIILVFVFIIFRRILS